MTMNTVRRIATVNRGQCAIMLTLMPQILTPTDRMAGLSPFARTLTLEIALSDLGLEGLAPDLEAYVARRSEDLASLTRLGLTSLGRFLAIAVLVVERRPFADLDPDRRRAWIALWDRSTIGPVRQYVRFYRSLALLWVFEHRYSGSLEDHR